MSPRSTETSAPVPPGTGVAQARRRIFVAVPLASALRRAVAGLAPHLREAEQSLRWVPPDNLHFTLKFLGEITPAQLARVAAAAKDVAARAQGFRIALAGLGAFPSPRRPQVVWVGVAEGADRLAALASDLDGALHRMTFPKEARPFRPHLTIARVRRTGPAPDLTAAIAPFSEFALGAQDVTNLLVMESTLHPSGAVYRQVQEVGLGESG